MSDNYIIDDILNALDAFAEKNDGSIDNTPALLRDFGAVYSFVCELDNGGLAQFLWDNLEHYESMLDVVENALKHMDAPEHIRCVQNFRVLCVQHAQSCADAILVAEKTQDVEHFFKWYREHELVLNTEENEIFAFDSGIGDILENWAESHESELRKEIALLRQK